MGTSELKDSKSAPGGGVRDRAGLEGAMGQLSGCHWDLATVEGPQRLHGCGEEFISYSLLLGV